tara:strand:+ start:1029 stop:3449 length:2421 start_codon:yes stop_codon:yes gene_type:complete
MLRCEFIGEAMQVKKLLYIFLIIPLMVFGQDIKELEEAINVKSLELMSDDELKIYWDQAQEKGYTLNQIKTLARAQGVSESELLKFEKRVMSLGENEMNNEDALLQAEDDISSLFGLEVTDEMGDFEEKNINIGIFGSSFFNNPNINPVPSLNIATPESYELGPGDELSISIWGAAENEYSSKISREGYLKIERIGPVYLSGLSISEAKIKLKNRLSKIYSGINSNVNKVFFDLTLLNTRSIVVNITGSVVAPGTYTLSSLTSPLNALYAAGGPNENGSYREIKIIRGGKQVQSVDLYDYFVKGSLKNFSLRDQDVILVPTYINRVFLRGEFKTNGIFETKDDETVSDLLSFNGGIASFGTKNEVYLRRIEGVNKIIKTVKTDTFGNFTLNDGDIIEARRVGDEIINSVTVEGAVMIPGEYELMKNPDVMSLVKSAGGLKEGALSDRAYIIREVDGFQQEAKTVDLKAAMNNDGDFLLRNNDRLIIASVEELTTPKQVAISGEVNEPGNFPFFRGMTIVDLILMAKGIKDSGTSSGIVIYRSTYDETQKSPVEAITVNLNENIFKLNKNQNTELMVNDLVVVRSKLGYQSKEYVTVSGLVKKPGDYALRTNKYSFYDLIKDFDGFLNDAELSGVKLRRPIEVSEIKETIDDVEGSSLTLNIDEFIEIGLDVKEILKSNGELSQYNLVLKDGDEIIVPKFDNSVEVNGAVQQATAISYTRGLTTKSAINNAGGFGPNAKKSAVYVVYQNGAIASTKSFLFIRNYPKLLPGSKVFVPQKAETAGKTSVAEIVGYTTSLVSIIALLKSL